MAQVIIIDDSRLAGMVVQRYLNTKNIDCLHIRTVQELFGLRGTSSKLRDAKPELILLDIVMPEMDGLDVLRKLKSRKDTKDVPVVMLTSTAEQNTISEALSRGAVGYLTKPVKQDKLFEELKRVSLKEKREELLKSLTGDWGSLRETESQRAQMDAGLADLNYMLDILDGDEEMMAILIEAFLDSVDDQFGEIEQGLEKEDEGRVKRGSHRLKGSVGNFGVREITDKADALEKMGADGNLSGARDLFDSLEENVATLCGGLKEWLAARS